MKIEVNSLLAVAIGIAAIVGRKKWAAQLCYSLGLKTSARPYELGYLVIGGIFVVAGVAHILGFGSWR